MAYRSRLLPWVTLLIFVYNIIVGYIVVAYTSGFYKPLFLILIFIDYVIIFYFMLAARSRRPGRGARGR